MTNATSKVHYTKDVEGRLRAHVLAKRTYRLADDGPLQVATTQLAVADEAVHYDGKDDRPIEHDIDGMVCARSGTDVIVQGSAFSPGGPCREMSVSVAVQRPGATRDEALETARRIRVIGNRRVRRVSGGLQFSAPEPFESMPISYTHAYGGMDRMASETHPDELAKWLAPAAEATIEDLSPYEYPRNPLGRGYVVFHEAKALEELELPNLEMPTDLLTPERLVLGSSERWPWAPRPACFDWCGHDWFPRVAFLGASPTFDGPAEDVPEVRDGYLPAALLEGDPLDHIGNEHSALFCHGAPPWMVFSDFVGGEVVLIENMHPRRRHLEISLVPEVPRMVLGLHGATPQEVKPALRTVVIQPDRELLICVWVGTAAVSGRPTEPQLEKTQHAVRWQR